MKRSEMLEHIEEELWELLRVLETASDKSEPHIVKNKADGILAFMEGFGMQPPHTKVINCNCYDHNWEPEDEKK